MELSCERLVLDLLAGGNEVQWLAQAHGPLPDLPMGVCKPLSGTDVFYDVAGVPFPLPYPTSIRALRGSFQKANLVVIVEANFAVSVLAYGLARLMKKKIMLIQHVGRPSTVSRIARGVMRVGEALFARPMVRNADVVVYVSPSVAAHFNGVRVSGITETIGHAVDVDVFRPIQSFSDKKRVRRRLGLPAEGAIACFVGRTTPSKGIDVVREMAELRPDWTFAIAGKGPAEPSDWKLPNIVALGQLKKDDVARLYGSSNVMILPSQSESYSLVVREAIACGCPVICSDQILETDRGLRAFINTTTVDLSEPKLTARRFSALLDVDAVKNPLLGRRHILRECAPDRIRGRYLQVLERALLRNRVGAA